MKNWIIILLLLLFFYQGNAQSSKVSLLSFNSSECIEEDLHFLFLIKNRIVSQEFQDSIFVIEIGVLANCSYNGQGKIEVSEDTLKLFYGSKDIPNINENGDTIGWFIEEAECDCCFHFIYSIGGLEKKEYVVVANNMPIKYSDEKYKTKAIKFDLINGDTLNYYDKYGRKQGLHRSLDSLGRIYREKYYIDDEFMHGLVIRKYYEDGTVKGELHKINNEKYKVIDYYPSGIKKKECLQKDYYDEIIECKEYDEEGNEIR